LSCGKKESPTDPTDPAQMDRDAIRNLVNSQHSVLLADASYYGVEDTTGSKDRPIDPLNLIYWFRQPTTAAAKDFFINISNDTAYVTITFNISGDLHLYFLKDYKIDSLHKNFSDDFTRNAVFVRVGNENDVYRGWRLRGLSPAIVKTSGSNLSIDSVSIECSDTFFNFSYQNLRSTWPVDDSLSSLPSISSGDSITITFYVAGDTADAYFHFGWNDTHARFVMFPGQSITVFSRGLRLPDSMPPKVNFAFDLIRYSALHTTGGVYSSAAFIIPVKIR
ncbi:hypothetical protein JW890_02965, partial [candidate division WOR-3 bacterium]|nr:hypothetical protein [candidate division WOR-3 bacterium]